MSTNAPPLEPAEHHRLSERAVGFGSWLAEFVDERRANPQDDLASRLVNAELDDGTPALSTDEVVGLIANILAAGTGTTANFIPLIIRELLQHPEQWAALKADKALVQQTVEEGLRLLDPVRGVRRVVKRDVVLGGVRIPAGAQLYLHYGSAQRDPSVFPEPASFDIFRAEVAKHFAFGKGIHLCLGAPLARLEVQLTLECLIDRIPGVRLVPDQEERWTRSLLIPDLEALWLEWDVS